MKITNLDKGKTYQLGEGAKLEVERTNPFFNDYGETTTPLDIPASDYNRMILGYPDTFGLREKLVAANVSIEDGEYFAQCRQIILSAQHKGNISSSFYINDGSFYSKIQNVKLKSIFKDEMVPGCSTIEECIKFCKSLVGGSNENYDIFPVLLTDDSGKDEGYNYKILNGYGAKRDFPDATVWKFKDSGGYEQVAAPDVYDFTELFSRRAILPLIVAAVLFGFGVQMAGGSETRTAKLLEDVTNCIMKTFKIITYYAPIGFFGFFAYLIAYHGPDLIGDYGRTLAIYYILSFVYMLISFPLYARFGGGKGAAKAMFSKLFRPAAMSFGTCSSVATIPTNMEVAEETGIPKDVSNIVVPLGATMHMDGSAMSAIIKVAFLFGMFGQDFTTGRALLAIVVAVFSSVAMSGIPGGGGTGELVLCSIFFPDHLAVAFPIALALGNLVDPPATMVNSAGDYVVSFIVARFVDGKDWLQKQLQKQKAEQ